MGDDPFRQEPSDQTLFLNDVDSIPLFEKSRWIYYCLQLTEYNDEMMKEFETTFWNNKATVIVIRVEGYKDTISKANSLPRIGEHFPTSLDPRTMRVEFSYPNETFNSTNQSSTQLSLPILQRLVILHAIGYFTCDGRHSMLYTIHFKLLSHLRHNRLVNMLNYLHHMLITVAIEYRKKRKPMSLSHHCLVVLLNKRSLSL